MPVSDVRSSRVRMCHRVAGYRQFPQVNAVKRIIVRILLAKPRPYPYAADSREGRRRGDGEHCRLASDRQPGLRGIDYCGRTGAWLHAIGDLAADLQAGARCAPGPCRAERAGREAFAGRPGRSRCGPSSPGRNRADARPAGKRAQYRGRHADAGCICHCHPRNRARRSTATARQLGGAGMPFGGGGLAPCHGPRQRRFGGHRKSGISAP